MTCTGVVMCSHQTSPLTEDEAQVTVSCQSPQTFDSFSQTSTCRYGLYLYIHYCYFISVTESTARMRIGYSVNGVSSTISRRISVRCASAVTSLAGPQLSQKKSPCAKCPRNNCRDCPTKKGRKSIVGEVQDFKAPTTCTVHDPCSHTVSADDGGLMLNSSALASTLALSMTVGGVNPFREFLQGQADYFSTLGLPDWLVHWGHPGNMAVVLLAMGGYGAVYLGWQIRLSDNVKVKQQAMDMHPKLAGGMAIFFALGSMGGMMSLLMQGQEPFSSSHFVTGMLGLAALAFQAMLPLFFDDDPQARNMHAFLGTGIMGLFVVHAFLGLQLGLSI